MSLDILLGCVLGPAITMLAAILLGLAAPRLAGPRPWLMSAQAVLSVAGWCAAVAVALLARQGADWWQESWWPDDAWQRALLPITGTGLALAYCAHAEAHKRDVRWLLAGLGAVTTAMIAMPAGAGWEDMFELHRSWMFAVTASALLNLWMLDAWARRDAQRWVLWVCLAGLAGPTFLAASAYAGLAEWLLAAITATLVAAIAAAILKLSTLWCVAYPSVLFAAAATAAGRFSTYEDHPAWLYGLILLMPAILAAIDIPLGNRRAAVRIAVAAVAAILLLAPIAWMLAPGESY